MRFRSLLLAMLTFTTGYVMGLASVQTQAMPETQPTSQWMERPCSYEDANNCFWDAGQGNGRGHSFYIHTLDGRVCIMYTQHTYSKHHDHCIEHENRRTMGDLDGDGYGAEKR